MHFRRELATSYILVFGGLALGLFVGIFVIEYDPPVVAWLFAAGGGMALGAFVAALVSGIPLVGNPGTGRRYVPLDDDTDENWRDRR
jgi:hypothetical protein